MELIRTKILTLLILLSVTGLFLNAQTGPSRPGEKANYLLHYGLITGGMASLELKNDTLNRKNVWHSIAIGKTTGMADALYKVTDIYECYIDPSTDLPVKSIRNVHEGRYKRYNVVLFDHKTRFDSTILNSDLTGIHTGPKGLHDILSCFYYFRKYYLAVNDDFKSGEIITIQTWFTDELYPVRLKYMGTEEVRTRLGKINCLKFNPVTEVGRLFKTEDDMSIWFSADKNFLPVKIRFDIFVGSITVDLISYEGLSYPLDIKTR
jgi:hypothetical protein